ncbi:MAG: hypothetical protein WC637_21890, partial [Victivallales bacterium]
MPKIQQQSFTSGEISPSLYGRTDIEQYSAACALLKNFLFHPHGGISNRPGTEFVAEALGEGVLKAFEYSITQTYVLEFTDQNIRIVKDGGLVVYAPGAGIDIVVDGTYKWTESGTADNEYYLELAAGGDPGLIRPVKIFENADATMQLIDSDAYEWIESASGTSEFYLQLKDDGGSTKLRIPDTIETNVEALDRGNAGALAAGSWDYTDNDSLGFSTIYVRLTDSVDPDTKAVTNIVDKTLYKWTKSKKGINEFRMELDELGGDPELDEPGSVREFIPGIIDGKLLDEGTLGYLSVGEWAYGDNDTLGYDTVYVRLTRKTYPDPDYRTTAGYLKAYDTGFLTAHYSPIELKEGTLGELDSAQFAYGDNDSLGFDTIYVRIADSGDPSAEKDGYLET